MKRRGWKVKGGVGVGALWRPLLLLRLRLWRLRRLLLGVTERSKTETRTKGAMGIATTHIIVHTWCVHSSLSTFTLGVRKQGEGQRKEKETTSSKVWGFLFWFSALFY
jgi:hypothetical protein